MHNHHSQKPRLSPSSVRWAVLAALTLTVVLAGCSSPGTNPSGGGSKSTEAVVGLTFIPNIQFAPFYVADKNNWYDASAKITLRHHGDAEDLFSAINTGTEQFVVAGGDEILEARTQGIDVVAVASYFEQYPSRVIVPADSPITSVADLKGHKVGLPGEFGENWYALKIALQEAGLTSDDVQIESIGYTQQAALTTGKVDAVIGFANGDVLNFETAGFPVRSIDPEVPLVSICLATTTAFAEANPQVVKDVIAAMRNGMDFSLNDPDSTMDIAADYIPSFRGDTLTMAQKVLPATTALFLADDGKTLAPPFDPAQWTAMGKAMESADLIPPNVDVTQAYSNNYN